MRRAPPLGESVQAHFWLSAWQYKCLFFLHYGSGFAILRCAVLTFLKFFLAWHRKSGVACAGIRHFSFLCVHKNAQNVHYVLHIVHILCIFMHSLCTHTHFNTFPFANVAHWTYVALTWLFSIDCFPDFRYFCRFFLRLIAWLWVGERIYRNIGWTRIFTCCSSLRDYLFATYFILVKSLHENKISRE